MASEESQTERYMLYIYLYIVCFACFHAWGQDNTSDKKNLVCSPLITKDDSGLDYAYERLIYEGKCPLEEGYDESDLYSNATKAMSDLGVKLAEKETCKNKYTGFMTSFQNGLNYSQGLEQLKTSLLGKLKDQNMEQMISIYMDEFSNITDEKLKASLISDFNTQFEEHLGERLNCAPSIPDDCKKKFNKLVEGKSEKTEFQSKLDDLKRQLKTRSFLGSQTVNLISGVSSELVKIRNDRECLSERGLEFLGKTLADLMGGALDLISPIFGIAGRATMDLLSMLFEIDRRSSKDKDIQDILGGVNPFEKALCGVFKAVIKPRCKFLHQMADFPVKKTEVDGMFSQDEKDKRYKMLKQRPIETLAESIGKITDKMTYAEKQTAKKEKKKKKLETYFKMGAKAFPKTALSHYLKKVPWDDFYIDASKAKDKCQNIKKGTRYNLTCLYPDEKICDEVPISKEKKFSALYDDIGKVFSFPENLSTCQKFVEKLIGFKAQEERTKFIKTFLKGMDNDKESTNQIANPNHPNGLAENILLDNKKFTVNLEDYKEILEKESEIEDIKNSPMGKKMANIQLEEESIIKILEAEDTYRANVLNYKGKGKDGHRILVSGSETNKKLQESLKNLESEYDHLFTKSKLPCHRKNSLIKKRFLNQIKPFFSSYAYGNSGANGNSGNKSFLAVSCQENSENKVCAYNENHEHEGDKIQAMEKPLSWLIAKTDNRPSPDVFKYDIKLCSHLAKEIPWARYKPEESFDIVVNKNNPEVFGGQGGYHGLIDHTLMPKVRGI